MRKLTYGSRCSKYFKWFHCSQVNDQGYTATQRREYKGFCCVRGGNEQGQVYESFLLPRLEMSGDCFKLAMKKKLTEAYLKGVSKIFEYLLSFLGYSRFCSKLDDVTNRFSKKINHKIKKISENIHSYFNIFRLLSKHGQVSRTSSLDAQVFPHHFRSNQNRRKSSN